MKSMKIVIELEHGLHVRPSAQFVQVAKQFNSDISLEYEHQVVSAKSIFNLQKLDLLQGATVTLQAKGSDEALALDALAPILQPSLKVESPLSEPNK